MSLIERGKQVLYREGEKRAFAAGRGVRVAGGREIGLGCHYLRGGGVLGGEDARECGRNSHGWNTYCTRLGPVNPHAA